MSAGNPFSPTRPRVTTLDLYNLADTDVRAGMDLIGRPLTVAAERPRSRQGVFAYKFIC